MEGGTGAREVYTAGAELKLMRGREVMAGQTTTDHPCDQGLLYFYCKSVQSLDLRTFISFHKYFAMIM